MNRPAALDRDIILAHFSRNLPRHIIGVAHALNGRLMQQCVDAGHTGLRPSFNQILAHLGTASIRVVDIAAICSITQQAAGQIVGELEHLGYVKRKTDSSDKRAKQLLLTAKGERLLADCTRLSASIDAELATVVEPALLAELKESSAQLYRELALAGGHPDATATAPYFFSLCLSGLATYCEQQLMELDRGKGHLRLKMSFSQVISHITPHGALINDMARLNGVSKQAISQVVKEVEELGYIERRQNPDDARSTKLFLTDYGLKLIHDSIENMSVIRARFVDVLGERKVKRFVRSIEHLYDHFHPAAAQLQDKSQQLRVATRLQHTLERLYAESGGSEDQSALFTRFANKLRLSPAALELLSTLEIRPDK